MQAGCTINYGRIFGPELAPKKSAGMGAESRPAECDNSLLLCTYWELQPLPRAGLLRGRQVGSTEAELWAEGGSLSESQVRCDRVLPYTKGGITLVTWVSA